VTSAAEIERRLTELRHEAAGVHRGARTNVVELVVWCASKEVADEAVDVIGSLSHNRPSRAIVLQPAESDVVEADASVFCAVPPDGAGNVLVCSEIVRLCGPADTGALPSMTRSLLLPDLPLFVLWLDEPDWDGAVARELLREAHRLVVDSTRHSAAVDGVRRLLSDDPPYVSDLSWTKITAWREVVALLFDPPDHRGLLPGLEHIRVDYVEGSDSQARLLCGWLRSRGARDAALELRPVVRPDMRAGSLVCVELAVDDLVLAVERPEEGVAVTHSPGLPDQRLGLRVPPFPGLLADELEFLPRDRVYEQSLEAAEGLPTAAPV
jgi:glucose-6-phosphate dehydrogenase assembly protein OpcA